MAIVAWCLSKEDLRHGRGHYGLRIDSAIATLLTSRVVWIITCVQAFICD